MARGRAQSTGWTASRREGLRGHGPAVQPDRSDRPRPACGAARLRRDPRGRDRARRHGGGAAGGRAHGTHHRAHERRPRLHPQPHPAGLRGLGPLQVERGRFQLGLGTQIRQNIEDRYGVPFGEDPIGRLRDYVGAVRAAFASFATGPAPSYESPHYSVTRLQPYFNPGPDTETVGPADLPGRRAAQGVRARRRHRGRLREPPDQLQPALPGRDLPARPGRRVPRRRPRPGGRWFETVVGTSVITGASADAVLSRTRTPAPAPRLFVLDAGLRTDPRPLRLGRAGTAAARPDPPRALGRPGRRALRRGARHPGAVRNLRRAAGPAAQRFSALGQGILMSPPTDDADDDAFARWSPPSAPAEPARARRRGVSARHRKDQLLGRHGLYRGATLAPSMPA